MQGIAFNEQMVAAVPTNEYDLPLDMVVTSAAVYGSDKNALDG